MRTSLLAVVLAGCWRDPAPKTPTPASQPPSQAAARAPAKDDAALCHVWVERSRPVVEKNLGTTDWDEIERGCARGISDEERPFVACVNDADDDHAVEVCWNTYFKLDLDFGKALGH